MSSAEPDSPHRHWPAGAEVLRTDAWTGVRFEQPRPVLSSAPVAGGEVMASRIVNLCVDGPRVREQCDDPEATFQRLSARHGWDGTTVGMMTGVPAARLGVGRERLDDGEWLVLATVGVRNAHRAGRPPVPAGDEPPAPGTINVIAVTPAGLTAAARTEAVTLIAEAKCAFLADRRIPSANGQGVATGTGTDAVAVACGNGNDVGFTGYHTRLGQALAAAVGAALARSYAAGRLG